jgi:cytochrome oxidase Cu insertion factor (SCO1/SenC/PrrC family)
MKFLALPLALAFLMPVTVHAAPEAAAPAIATVGKAAPEFTGTDTKGTVHKLSDFKGKTVVLEWNNPECPYVVKHYGSQNMQALQKAATADGVVWLTVNSSAAGKQGNMTGEAADKYVADQGAAPTAYILDAAGTIGKLYDAKTTPHMYIINPEGVLVYAGAIDSDDSFKPEAIAGSKNYVTAALQSLKDGKSVEMASTKPYGCGIKYSN